MKMCTKGVAKFEWELNSWLVCFRPIVSGRRGGAGNDFMSELMIFLFCLIETKICEDCELGFCVYVDVRCSK